MERERISKFSPAQYLYGYSLLLGLPEGIFAPVYQLAQVGLQNAEPTDAHLTTQPTRERVLDLSGMTEDQFDEWMGFEFTPYEALVGHDIGTTPHDTLISRLRAEAYNDPAVALAEAVAVMSHNAEYEKLHGAYIQVDDIVHGRDVLRIFTVQHAGEENPRSIIFRDILSTTDERGPHYWKYAGDTMDSIYYGKPRLSIVSLREPISLGDSPHKQAQRRNEEQEVLNRLDEALRAEDEPDGSWDWRERKDDEPRDEEW